METRVADFARASGGDNSSDEEDKDDVKPSGSSPNGPVEPSVMQPAYGLSFPPPGNGFAGSAGQNGNGDVKVKAEPHEALRLRGGAVSLINWLITLDFHWLIHSVRRGMSVMSKNRISSPNPTRPVCFPETK